VDRDQGRRRPRRSTRKIFDTIADNAANAGIVLGHPATSVAWLANKIAPNGLALEVGQVVLAGSFIRPIETRKGDTIQADYGPYGTVSCYFA
jgi:2-oxo-hept-3-ene-1,7-dioate hydratase